MYPKIHVSNLNGFVDDGEILKNENLYMFISYQTHIKMRNPNRPTTLSGQLLPTQAYVYIMPHIFPHG